MKHRLIVIGYLGVKRCYLDVDMEEAIRRFQHTEGFDNTPEDRLVSQFEFDDEFECYDAWSDTPEKVSNVGQPR